MKFYKATILIFFLLFLNEVKGQQGSIVYSYDAGGKMTERKIQVMQGGRIGNFDKTTKDSLPQREFKVFPNPTSQYLTIEGELPENTPSGEMSLLNISGQVIKKEVYTGVRKDIPIYDLKPGMYLLEIRYSKKEKSSYKIIVSN
jgi:hypothetical protein